MSETSPHLSEVTSLIQQVVTTVDLTAIVPETFLYELGIDSLATVNVLVEITNTAQVDLDDFIDDIDPPKTINDLCQIVSTVKGMNSCN
jgi:acyl carrier protein